MFAKVESILISEDKRRLFSNFLYLFILQGANYVLPLLTLPYLIRILGAEKFGLYVFAQAFIGYFLVFTDYGFNLSATREVSINRDNSQKISEIFCSVMTIKILFMTISFTILSIIIFSFDKFRSDWLFYFLTFGMVLGNILFPTWFFMGMEKMKYITFLNLFSKAVFTISIFVFIRQSAHYFYVPLINSLGYLVAGAFAIRIIFKEHNIDLYLPKIKTIIQSLKDSTQFFLSRVSTMIYTSNNSFVLGLFTGNQIVGYYATAEKLNFALKSLYYPLSDNLYPYMSRERKISLFKKIVLTTSIFNILLCTFTFIFANQIISIIFGDGLEISANVLKVFSLAVMVSVPATLIGYPLLGAYGKANLVNLSYIIGSVLHFVGLIVLAVLSKITVYNVALMVLATEILIFLVRLYFVIKTDFTSKRH
ncbi:MAG: RfbX protein [Candidatus Melainabacteria bacterium RIFOXYA2_FULL_32_9]|nr:MAG: RfbX protein [Candidatus Melainabacteria bacterium RIFOXYA2_FULL_32_9]